jgi:hypothetical protein
LSLRIRASQPLSGLSTLVLILLLSTIPLTSCSAQYANYSNAPAPPAQAQILEAQQGRMIKTEVTVEAPVYKLLPDDTRGLPHQKFLIQLANGSTVLIAHDTAMAPRVPIQPGDVVRIHGEYIWNQKGGLIHWTHHTDTPRHEGGWILFNGQVYQ